MKKSLAIFVAFYVAFFVANYCNISFSPFYALFIIFGVIALIFIPGFFFSVFLKNDFCLTEEFGFSLIFGLMLQAFNVVIMWVLLDHLVISFAASIAILTLIEVLGMFILLRRRKVSRFQFNNEYSFDILLIITFVVAIVVSLLYQNYNINYITPDGAYYCDIARNIFNEGVFKPKFLTPISLNPVLGPLEQLGFIGHPLVPFTLSLSFLIGGVSYSSAKLMETFVGSLLVFPVYSLGKELFNKKAGIIAALIIALFPLRVFYSSILFGNEMISTLYFFSAFFFLVIGFKQSGKRGYLLLAGALLFLSELAWIQATFFLPIIPFLVTLVVTKITRKLIFWGIILSGLAFFFTNYGVFFINYLYWIFIIIIQLILCIIGLRYKEGAIRQISLFYLAYTILTLFWSVRAFSHPEVFSIIGYRYSQNLSNLTPPSQILSFVTRANLYSQTINTYLGSLLIILSILSFLLFQKYKNKFLLCIYPLFYSIILIVYLNIGFEDRLLISIIPFLSLLSATFIESLLSISKDSLRGDYKKLD